MKILPLSVIVTLASARYADAELSCGVLTSAATECPGGWEPAGLELMTNCSDTICTDLMGPYDFAHGMDQGFKLLGSGFGCRIDEWDGSVVNTVICEPIPTPIPPPSVCRLLDGHRPCGNLVDASTLSSCKDHICRVLMSPDSVAYGASRSTKLLGTSSGCVVAPWDGVLADGFTCVSEKSITAAPGTTAAPVTAEPTSSPEGETSSPNTTKVLMWIFAALSVFLVTLLVAQHLRSKRVAKPLHVRMGVDPTTINAEYAPLQAGDRGESPQPCS